MTECRCLQGYPKMKTYYTQSHEGRDGATQFHHHLPIKVTYKTHTGQCPLVDEFIRLRRVA